MKTLKQNNTLIIIPVFNEANNIGSVVDNLLRNFQETDILVVNDGSFDSTAEALKNKSIFVLHHLFNIGIGASFQIGCQFAQAFGYDYIVRMDGDGQHDPLFIKDILEPIKNNLADISIGSRFLGKSQFKSSFTRLFGIFIISSVLMGITNRKVTDPTSGFCAMNRKAFEFFANNYIEDYPEPEILLHHKNFRIQEIPISMSKRQKGISSITPLKSIYYMYRVLLSLTISLFRRGEI